MLPLYSQGLLLTAQMRISRTILLLAGLFGINSLERQINLRPLEAACGLIIIGPALLNPGYVLPLTVQHGIREQEDCRAAY